MNRRYFAKRAARVLAAVGTAIGVKTKVNADVVNDADFKPPAPKIKVKITEILLNEFLLFDRDDVQWRVSYDVTHSDGSMTSRVATHVGPKQTVFSKSLSIELDLS